MLPAFGAPHEMRWHSYVQYLNMPSIIAWHLRHLPQAIKRFHRFIAVPYYKLPGACLRLPVWVTAALLKKSSDCKKSVDKSKKSVIISPLLAGVAHPVERHLAKVEVASSSLVTRSKGQPSSAGLFCRLQQRPGIPYRSRAAVHGSFSGSSSAAVMPSQRG